ncbi:hypothetical protein, partial [Methanoculleus sp.]|uniref:hypothetical protein n=1 Tax=Methanoculleus sp. TaxID=90427 RepID=UPI00261D35F2
MLFSPVLTAGALTVPPGRGRSCEEVTSLADLSLPQQPICLLQLKKVAIANAIIDGLRALGMNE